MKKIKESEVKNIVQQVINEQYNPDRLYDREIIIDKLRKAPFELRKYIKELPKIACLDSQGNKRTCTKLPEIIHVYISGRY